MDGAVSPVVFDCRGAVEDDMYDPVLGSRTDEYELMEASPVLFFLASPRVGAFLSGMERPSPANASLGATDGVSTPPLDDDAFDSAGRGGRVGSLGTLDGAPLKESANPFD
jgi:hypothetical protein